MTIISIGISAGPDQVVALHGSMSRGGELGPVLAKAVGPTANGHGRLAS